MTSNKINQPGKLNQAFVILQMKELIMLDEIRSSPMTKWIPLFLTLVCQQGLLVFAMLPWGSRPR